MGTMKCLYRDEKDGIVKRSHFVPVRLALLWRSQSGSRGSLELMMEILVSLKEAWKDRQGS